MAKTVYEALKTAHFYSDKQDYVIIKLPAKAITVAAGIMAEAGEPFCALIVDKDEVSLMIVNNAIEDFASRLSNHHVSDITYKLITIEAELDLDMLASWLPLAKP